MTWELFVRIIADGAVVPIVLIGAYALLFMVNNKQKIRIYSQVLLAGLTAYLIAKMIGVVYQPALERPFEILGVDPGALYLNNPGFPSDHALFVTAVVLAVWFSTKNKILTVILTILAALVYIGRILALVHTPLDVIGGVVIASIGALWYLNGDLNINGHNRKRLNG